MSFPSSSLAISNDDIDPAILADVARVVQELMRLQQQEQEQQQCDNYSHHDTIDDFSSISRKFPLEHMDGMDVDVSPLSNKDEREKLKVEQGDNGAKDQSLLLPSSPTLSSITSLSNSSLSSLSSCDDTASPVLTSPSSSLLSLNVNNGSGSDQVLINLLPGQKTPTRATSSTTGPTNSPNEEGHKYYEHESIGKKSSPTEVKADNGATTATATTLTAKQESPSATEIIPRPIPQAPTRPRRKKALLIGINYFGDPNQLLGCINDTRDVFGFLNGYFGFRYQDTIMLTDDQVYEDKRPTGANIRYWMKWLVKDAQPQDSLFFHYAGHGGRIKDFSYNGKGEHLGDEADGYDEIIYPCDYLRSGIISDDEMYDLMVKDLPTGVQLTALVDACHSGTMLDLPYVYNGDHVTALDKVTRTKVGAMAAMSASDVVFDPPGSNNNVQTMTTTTTTTTTTVTTTNADGTASVTQYMNGTAMSQDGHLAPPGGLPPINTKEGGSPLMGPGQTSKRSLTASEDGASEEGNADVSADDLIPTLTISESENDCLTSSSASPPYTSSTPFLSVQSASDESDSDDSKPSPRKRSKSVNNILDQVDVRIEEEVVIVNDQRGIECVVTPIETGATSIEIEVIEEAKPSEEQKGTELQKVETKSVNLPEDEGMEEAHRMAMFRKTNGNVVMFSGCRDDQASADIRASSKDAAIISDHHKSLNGGSTTNWSSPSMEDAPNPLGYSLPQPYSSPLARGAVSYAWIQCLSQKTNQTYEELLVSMRHFMKQRDLEQVPQLGSGMPMDMRAVFTL
ncbi:Ca(2+)-dependent cysteine protease [Mortierella sp. AM989]|nr:Ca(2+)-dependent cysteine protease [Mortierella sp. AM989]